MLAAPTGCASFQMRFGASTLHRQFGIPVGYCGPWKNRSTDRFLTKKKRMDQARIFIMDEMSMIGRRMLGKIEYKVRDILFQRQVSDDMDQKCLGGKDAVLSGDPKQAAPIGDEPMYRDGAYIKKGENKPRGSAGTPDDAWSNKTLVVKGMQVRDTFKDTVLLRQVHRHRSDNEEISPDLRSQYRADATKFLDTMRKMADLSWERKDHDWLAKRNRTTLQQTAQGREELKKFESAPLLMDGRKDRITGEVGAMRINQEKLQRLSEDTQKPIFICRAYHDTPKTEEGKKMRPKEMDADDFRGMENELQLCEGARVLLTQNLWVEAGLMNGALGRVVGYV